MIIYQLDNYIHYLQLITRIYLVAVNLLKFEYIFYNIMKIQYASDLHLDHLKIVDYESLITPVGDVLVLAGDICGTCARAQRIFYPFIKWCCSRFKHVLLVAGNHEYYRTSIVLGDKFLTVVAKHFNNFHFMNKKTMKIEGIIFLGVTLWSDIPPEHVDVVASHLNDFNYIRDFNTNVFAMLHKDHAAWLESELISHGEKKIVVITHHAPLMNGTSDPKYTGLPTNHGFATDLGDLVACANYWICGHTHHCASIEYEDCTVLLNCLGYPSEFVGYSPTACFEIVSDKKN